MMERTEKKEYNVPEVVDFGDVVALTRNSGAQNSDGQGDNTACFGDFCSDPRDP